MATQLTVIQRFMRYLDTTKSFGESALNGAIKSSSPYKNGITELRENIIKDIRENSTNSEDFLKTYCGIDFDSIDNGAITGAEVGNTKVKTATDIIKESDSLKTAFKETSFLIDDLSVELANNKEFRDLNDNEKFIWQGLYTWWVKGALDLITESYGDNFSFRAKNATTNKLYVKFVDEDSESNASISGSYDEESGKTTELTLTINTHNYNDLKDDLTTANSEFDLTIAHELAYAAMRANLLYAPTFRSLSGFTIEGLAELVTGIKNSREDEIRALVEDTTRFDIGLDERNMGNDEDFMYAGGFIFFRYLARHAGDLNISNSTTNTIVRSFYGHDTITNTAANVTINSNADNVYNTGYDNIYNTGKKVLIFSGNGKDTIESKGANVTIISGDGKDSIINSKGGSKSLIDSGTGHDTISNAGNNVTITSGAGNDNIENFGDSVSIDVGVGKDTIETGGSKVSINGDAGNDYISLNETATFNTIICGLGNDTVFISENSTNNKISGDDGDDVIHSEGIRTSINTGKGNDYIQLYPSSKNHTVVSGEGKDSIYSGLKTGSILAGADNDYIHIYSSAEKNTINAGKGNDIIKNYCTSGVMYFYAADDGNDLIEGFTAKDTLMISNSTFATTESGKDVLVTVKDSVITLDGAATLSTLKIVSNNSTLLSVTDMDSSPLTVSSAVRIINASLRTEALEITANKRNNTIRGGSGNDTFHGGIGDDSILGNAGDDVIYGQKGDDILYGNNGNDTLYGSLGNDYLSGGAGNDYLDGGKGNDTLSGGDGSDVFICGTGKNIITDYATGDKISLTSAITNTTFRNSDVIFNMGSNSVTIKSAKGKTLNMINPSGEEYTTVVGSNNSKTLTVTNSTKSPVTVDSSIKIIDASLRTKAVKITGNSLANTITGGSGKDSLYGGKGNDSLVGNAGNDKLYGNLGNDILRGGAGADSLWGDAGNDSLWGGNGNDTFIYASGEGTDRIFDYSSGDMLKILKSNGTAGGKFKKSKYSNGTLALTISGGGSVIFENVTSSTRFNINDNFYKVRDSKLAKVT